MKTRSNRIIEHKGLDTSISRRSVLRAGAAFGALSAFSLGMGMRRDARAANVESAMNIMGWAEYINPDNIAAWEEDTGARFIFDGYSSNDEMLSKLQLANGQSGYDIGMNTDFMIPLLISRGLIQKLDRSQIPNFSNLNPDFLGQSFDPENEYTIPKNWGSQGYLYDKSVTGDIKSWNDFIRAAKNEASGMVSLLDDPLAIAPLMWKDGISWNTTDESVLDRVEEEAIELAPHIRTFNTYPASDVDSGTVKLVQNWNGYAKLIADSANDPNLVFDYGSPMTELWLDSYHMPTGGDHPKAGHHWLNFIIDPKRAAMETSYAGYASPVSGSEDYMPEEVASSPMVFPSSEVVKRAELTQRNESYDRRIAIFTKFKAAAAL